MPAGKFTVREREMLIGSGILPPEFFAATRNPFVIGAGACEHKPLTRAPHPHAPAHMHSMSAFHCSEHVEGLGFSMNFTALSMFACRGQLAGEGGGGTGGVRVGEYV